MMTMSMLVRLSSTPVGEDGDTKWSYKDLQSVAMIGGRFDGKDLHSRTSNLPSRASLSIKLSHSTVPVAVDMA